jgi:hypothetical protein
VANVQLSGLTDPLHRMPAELIAQRSDRLHGR